MQRVYNVVVATCSLFHDGDCHVIQLRHVTNAFVKVLSQTGGLWGEFNRTASVQNNDVKWMGFHMHENILNRQQGSSVSTGRTIYQERLSFFKPNANQEAWKNNKQRARKVT